MDITHIKYAGDDGNPLYASTLGSGQPIIMLHGGGPDRQSIIPFANLLKHEYQVIFPDIRGYGESHCIDESKHTWAQYANDVLSLINFLKLDKITISGMGLGASISERFALSYADRASALILISPETLDKDGEGSSQEEIEMLAQCGEVALKVGLTEAWKPFLPHLTRVINSMVQEAIPRTNAASFAAALAIVCNKRLESHVQLSKIVAPILIIPGNDDRHSSTIGQQYEALIPNCTLGRPIPWNEIDSVEQFAANVVPQINEFLAGLF